MFEPFAKVTMTNLGNQKKAPTHHAHFLVPLLGKVLVSSAADICRRSLLGAVTLASLAFVTAAKCEPTPPAPPNVVAPLGANPPVIKWFCSTMSQTWKETIVTDITSAHSADTNLLALDASKQYQTMDGFGGCFNELGWQALLALDVSQRELALKELFDPACANLTLGRVPIGANDFSLEWYSLDETPDDYEMKDFSIEHDRRELIPFIKAAMKYQPKLGVWGVPWSPPAWMKTNGHYKGGQMKQAPPILAAYALYFSKYVQAYRAEGMNVYAIMPQNEPNYNNNIYPQCLWTGAELNVFLRDYLTPRLQQDHLYVEVWLGTIVKRNLAEYVDPVLGDPVTSPAITGVGYQYGGQLAMSQTHKKYPSMKLMQTETECYDGTNSWDQGMKTFCKIIADANHFASSYFYWNMILNESGRSTWNWCQNSMLTVDRKADAVHYNPEFYSLKHFSAAVLPGARRIAVNGGSFTNAVGFLNPLGSEVLVFANEADQDVSADLETDGVVVKLDVPAKSMNTVIIR